MKNIHRMLEDIKQETLSTAFLTGRKALSPEVMAAMGKVPREQFVAPEMEPMAFDNGPLPIGYGQTISQPFIVALMTDLLGAKRTDRILEIGTGSGYQSAILSFLAEQVYTVEVIEDLSVEAAARFEKLGYRNIHVKTGNGYDGWPEEAPYDGVIVTAAAPYIPEPLIGQLKAGGRLVIPVGRPFEHQELIMVEKQEHGANKLSKILDVAFVPLVDQDHSKRWH
ncbi:protein-L-isoaspartate(D-aspartate) O-methyltransferase [Candidatus Methylomicrobium oryzae]|jgi:protein-L-isoaspartate(D-aspartate) O-methyltransferase|uniref:protein-L-isoaspartate(D-aspartate) O-methyltransferase n=1 Tax=Candidatus Methylomicrobium oryzae TaxID=2802053 RepID=UPI0019212B7B|nr:protein-L-isoaspartate(D-aspartate) O-methyltransferase [Methylomicrobium sp. RS1]MBL1262302.1 protein-L-isoaspartate(D-aspartate) O-methyltransferase [Methylomicrobium sp. RS1]